MDILRISLIAIPDAGVDVAAELSVTAIQSPDFDPLPVDAVYIEGSLTPLGDEFLFRGRLAGEFAHECDRCLCEARHAFDLEVAWLFEEGPPLGQFEGAAGEVDSEDAEALGGVPGVKRFQGSEIDLRLSIWEELQFAEPVKYICSEGCLGLCPECGVNLNESPCGCAAQSAREERRNSGLSGLAGLYPDLAPKKSKE